MLGLSRVHAGEGSTLDVDLQLGGLHFKIRICAERLNSIGNGTQNLRQFILEKSIICKFHAMCRWRHGERAIIRAQMGCVEALYVCIDSGSPCCKPVVPGMVRGVPL